MTPRSLSSDGRVDWRRIARSVGFATGAITCAGIRQAAVAGRVEDDAALGACWETAGPASRRRRRPSLPRRPGGSRGRGNPTQVPRSA